MASRSEMIRGSFDSVVTTASLDSRDEARRIVERRGERTGGLIAGGGILCETAIDYRGELLGHTRSDAPDLRRLLHHVLDQHRRRRPGVERQLSRHRLEPDDAQRVHIASPVDALPQHLLGTHVVHGAQHLAGRRRGRGFHEPGDAEVGHDGGIAPTLEEDVLRLDVAVNHAPGVRVVERQRDLLQQARGIERRQRSLRCETLGQRLAVDVPHHEEDDAVLLVGAVDGDDVGVRELCRGPGFAQEPVAHSRRLGQMRGQHLDRDFPVKIDIDREIDDAHPAATELSQDLEIRSQGPRIHRELRCLLAVWLNRIQRGAPGN